jgi:microcystin-dependent protein
MAYIGEIRPFASALPPGWAPCDGRLLKITDHQALFSAIGTQYGGNGTDNFALPDLRGRVTAGVDPQKNQRLGDTSGRSSKSDDLIPFRVVTWAIGVFGVFPTP